jgi:hypothetical protein
VAKCPRTTAGFPAAAALKMRGDGLIAPGANHSLSAEKSAPRVSCTA